VLDAAGKPVPEAEVARGWRGFQGRMVGWDGFQADGNGRFRGDVEVYDTARPMVLVAFDAERKRAGIATWDPAKPDELLEFHLQPAIRVHGRFLTAETKQVPSWTNVYVYLLAPGPRESGSCSSSGATGEARAWAAVCRP
jgi:hypothetical protein